MELISEDVLKIAAEMVIYLNFCSTKEVWFFSKLLHKKSVVQILLGNPAFVLIPDRFINSSPDGGVVFSKTLFKTVITP